MNQLPTKPTEIEAFINEHFPYLKDPYVAAGKCLDICLGIQRKFPDIKVAKGVVSSHTNPDNISGAHYDKQYQHAWIKTQCGQIVDPTVSQFCLIGEITYHEFDDNKETRRCHFCGKYHQGTELTCGHDECVNSLKDDMY